MGTDVIKVIRCGMGASIQDFGRPGFARFGVPPSGVMDQHASGWANKLLSNPTGAPVIEVLMQGAHFEVLRTCWMVIAGADSRCNFPRWRIIRAHQGENIVFALSHSGLWAYLALEGGFDVPKFFGSASTYPRGRIGNALATGDLLKRGGDRELTLPEHVAGRLVAMDEQRDYNHPPPIRVWRGPQWDMFSPKDRGALFQHPWSVASQSDRVGYRLHGTLLSAGQNQIVSEPVLVGSIQVPQNGQPIVTMRDGPTVGGYPKIGLVHADDLSWLAQCRPGVTFQFQPAHED
jgi:biotin-dependent carboxylase-like uncharacterized protein